MNQGFNARHARKKGTVLVLVTIALAVMIGIVGLAIDTGQLYVTKQLEQATADAAAQAGAMDLFNYDPTKPNQAIATATTYAQNAGFVNIGPANLVKVTYADCTLEVWCSNGQVNLSTNSPNLIEVQITQTVNTTLLRVLGETSSTVTSTAFAGVTVTTSPVPGVIATHPTLAGALALSGGASLTVSGGIQRSIQVNSSSSSAVSFGGTINLSAAGPLGSGGDLAAIGGPPQPGSVNLGTTGHYVQPASTIVNPLESVVTPPMPGVAPAQVSLGNGVSGCPPSPLQPCVLYSPGLYATGIDILNRTAVFKPGIYYISSGGFTIDSGGSCVMATGVGADPGTGWTGNMLVYNTRGTFSSRGSFGSCTLTGSPVNSNFSPSYYAGKGILFFQDPSSPTQIHNFAGSGTLSLTGILYMSNPAAIAASQYQTLTLGGGTRATIDGGIIANVLSLSGSAAVTVASPTPIPLPNVRQVALVQ